MKNTTTSNTTTSTASTTTINTIVTAMRADLTRWNRQEERANALSRRINAEMETADPDRFAVLSKRLHVVYLHGEVAEREGRNLASALGLIAYYREEVIA